VKVIEGGNQKPKLKLWVCDDCGATTAIKVRRLPHIKSGKVQGGQDAWLCAGCFAQGKLNPVKWGSAPPEE
jgi:hypothetical protein